MNNTPQRIQRKRTKGWQMPPNTVYVGRGSKWGNPFRVVQYSDGKWAVKCDDDENQVAILTAICRAAYDTKQEAQADAVECYRILYASYSHGDPIDKFFESMSFVEMVESELKCKNLACWCTPGEPCHADFLIEIANK
jgi:hypothetical protein